MALANWMRIERASGTGRVEVSARRIYILPTRYGIVFAALLFLMLLGAVNYGNNPAHLLTFLLAGLGSNAIYLTWRDLRGLRLVCQGAAPVFEGQEARFVIDLDAGGRERAAIQLMFEHAEPVLVDLNPGHGTLTRYLSIPGLRRGLHSAGRLVISTRYPLGLFRAWCHVVCEQAVLVYPRPGDPWSRPGNQGETRDGGEEGAGREDFSGLRGYRPGDRPSTIDWKSYARDRGLNTRMFSGQETAPQWIDWKDAPGQGTEDRISALTRAVVDAEAGGQVYGLRIPGSVIEPGLGAAHRHLCLRKLALYGSPDA